MTPLEKLQKIFQRIFAFANGGLSHTTCPEDIPQWDSIGHMHMVSAVEKEFGIRFELNETMEMDDVGKILQILATKGIQ